MEVGRWSSRPSLMTPKPARKGRDRSWFLQLVPNQVQLSRWRSKSAAPQEIISRSSRTSRRRRLCDGLRDDELAVVPSLSRHVADHGLRVFGLRQGLEVGDRRAGPRPSHRSFSMLPSLIRPILIRPIKHSGREHSGRAAATSQWLRRRRRICCSGASWPRLAGSRGTTRWPGNSPFPSRHSLASLAPAVIPTRFCVILFYALCGGRGYANVSQFRILSCFKLNPFEHLNLSFDSSVDEVKKQYRKVELLSYF
ncbi:hypothetical protein BHE74_00038104 [Ensete ventricosum]|nr:hypothetical protein BHE74_00038104 [Ensete ventricosum]